MSKQTNGMLAQYPTISRSEVSKLFEYCRNSHGLTIEQVTHEVGTGDDGVMSFLVTHLWQLENDWIVAGVDERVPVAAHPDWVRSFYTRADRHDRERGYAPVMGGGEPLFAEAL